MSASKNSRLPSCALARLSGTSAAAMMRTDSLVGVCMSSPFDGRRSAALVVVLTGVEDMPIPRREQPPLRQPRHFRARRALCPAIAHRVGGYPLVGIPNCRSRLPTGKSCWGSADAGAEAHANQLLFHELRDIELVRKTNAESRSGVQRYGQTVVHDVAKFRSERPTSLVCDGLQFDR